MGGVWFGVQGQRAVRQHLPDAVRHPAMARNHATLSRFRGLGMPIGTASFADSPRSVREGAKSLVPRKGKRGVACRGRGENRRFSPLKSGRQGSGAHSQRPSGLWVLSPGRKYRPAQRSKRSASCVRQVYLSCVWGVRHILPTPPFFEKKGAVDGTKETLRGTGPPAPPDRYSGGLRSPWALRQTPLGTGDGGACDARDGGCPRKARQHRAYTVP